MRNIALVMGIIGLVSGFAACVNDPTLDQTVMSATDTSTSSEVVEVVDTETEVVVDSSTSTDE